MSCAKAQQFCDPPPAPALSATQEAEPRQRMVTDSTGDAQDGRRDAGDPAGARHVARLEALAQLRRRAADAPPCALKAESRSMACTG